ncbi:hypothetical protein HY995_03505 [Candidatus Micrarchaeota archaeon]|nr:hypothetical protein [Candidatus Micrarchaeota archaeon]MBI5177126.1 hypothetical protein [Candidatus Micrarchaeota archaeon]
MAEAPASLAGEVSALGGLALVGVLFNYFLPPGLPRVGDGFVMLSLAGLLYIYFRYVKLKETGGTDERVEYLAGLAAKETLKFVATALLALVLVSNFARGFNPSYKDVAVILSSLTAMSYAGFYLYHEKKQVG